MIDFNKICSPEAREIAKKRREELERSFVAKEKAQKKMINYLLKIEGLTEWEQNFVSSVAGRLQVYGTLTDKQDTTLTKLFEKY